MSRAEVISLRTAAVDAGIAMAEASEAMKKARDALNLTLGNYDRAQMAYKAASEAAQKAEAVLVNPELNKTDTKVAASESAPAR